MKVGIYLFEQYKGDKNIGSSRIRGHWLVKHWPEAEIFKMGQRYDVVIYQKAYMVQHARLYKGTKIFDVCDPDFLNWGYQFKEMIDECDAVTTSTDALAEVIRNFTDKPVVCIPDRIDPTEFVGKKKEHKGRATKTAWFGYSTNFDVLRPVLPYLKQHKLELAIISNRGFQMPSSYHSVALSNLPFSWNTICGDLLNADIVLNPQMTFGRWKFKSNNKSLVAWMLGLPVASNTDELQRFLDPAERQKEAEARAIEIEEKWHICHSVADYKKLIEEIRVK